MARRLLTDIASIVRMLCVRSASFTRITRRSRTIASSILRNDSGLRFLAALEFDLVEFGDAVDELGHRRAETRRKLILGRRRIFDDVVQDRRHDGVGVEMQVREDGCGGHRVGDVGLAGKALLALMRGSAELGRFADAGNLLGGKVRAHRGQQFL